MHAGAAIRVRRSAPEGIGCGDPHACGRSAEIPNCPQTPRAVRGHRCALVRVVTDHPGARCPHTCPHHSPALAAAAKELEIRRFSPSAQTTYDKTCPQVRAGPSQRRTIIADDGSARRIAEVRGRASGFAVMAIVRVLALPRGDSGRRLYRRNGFDRRQRQTCRIAGIVSASQPVLSSSTATPLRRSQLRAGGSAARVLARACAGRMIWPKGKTQGSHAQVNVVA